MGIFDLFKKKHLDETPPSTWLPTPPPVYDYDRTRPKEDHFTVKMNQSDLKRLDKEPDFSHLDENGELPFGWLYQNKEFTDKINSEFRYFLNSWLNSREKGVRQERGALESFIQYMKDAQKLCDAKGECFSFWCSCIIGKAQLEKRQNDLKYIEEHFDELLEKESCRKDIEQNLLPHLKNDLLKIIRENPGILQCDIYKLFDKSAKEYISSELYFMEKNHFIIREKSGRTYSIKVQK